MTKKKTRKAGANATRKPCKTDKPPARERVTRRTVLKSAVAVGVALTIGAGIHVYDTRSKTLHDLSIIGGGKPVVVQVHDPSCALCRQLKRSTETALESSAHIAYRIADLTTREGEQFALKYGAGKVTLLLFNGLGRHINTIQGVTPADQLQSVFERQFSL